MYTPSAQLCHLSSLKSVKYLLAYGCVWHFVEITQIYQARIFFWLLYVPSLRRLTCFCEAGSLLWKMKILNLHLNTNCQASFHVIKKKLHSLKCNTLIIALMFSKKIILIKTHTMNSCMIAWYSDIIHGREHHSNNSYSPSTEPNAFLVVCIYIWAI